MATLTPELTTGGVEVGDSTGWAIRQGVVDLLKTLALPGIDRIYHRAFPNLEGLAYPCGIVAKGRGVFGVEPSPVGRTDNRYAVYVVFARASQRQLDGSTDHSKQLDVWLEETARVFNGTRPAIELPPGVCMIGCRVVDNDPQRAPEWLRQLDAVYLLLNFTVRESMPSA